MSPMPARPLPPTTILSAAQLAFAEHAGRTEVTHCRAASPLKFLTPRHAGTAAWVCASSHGGGYLSGDRVRIELEAGPRARAALTTQASTKIYPGAAGSSQELSAKVAAGALLVMTPDPVVCYADSAYCQTQDFNLAPSASLVVVDWLTSGRAANQERWKFRAYESRLSIRRGGCLDLHEATRLTRDDGPLPTRMGRFDVVGMAAITGPLFRAARAQLLNENLSLPVVRRASLLISAAPFGKDGVLLRFASQSLESAQHELRRTLSFVWKELGEDPWSRRN